MNTLLHVSSSPRGEASESRRIADAFVEAYRDANPSAAVESWDLWDGSLPQFGPDAAAAKMTIFGGGTPKGPEAVAWRAALDTFTRFDSADRLLFSVPMWNSGVPYILKQFIDVISQPGFVFDVDPHRGYRHLLEGRGKKAAVIYTSAVWGPDLGREFGRDFHSTYFADWLCWIGVDEVEEIRFHPTLTGDAAAARAQAHAHARDLGKRF